MTKQEKDFSFVAREEETNYKELYENAIEQIIVLKHAFYTLSIDEIREARNLITKEQLEDIEFDFNQVNV